jgi:hypothetical protein
MSLLYIANNNKIYLCIIKAFLFIKESYGAYKEISLLPLSEAGGRKEIQGCLLLRFRVGVLHNLACTRLSKALVF